jgi:hypothetical protein
LTCYLSLIGLVTLSTLILLWWGLQRQAVGMVSLSLLFVPALVCASSLGVGIVHWLATRLVPPQSLPRMDFEHGIPADHRTLVAVPTMLTSPAGIRQALAGLEVRYLANRDPHLHFALLTDFVDAAEGTLAGDAELVELVRTGIMQLNTRYAHVRTDILHLLHRSRRWNPKEGVWMGHERKRGKLADLKVGDAVKAKTVSGADGTTRDRAAMLAAHPPAGVNGVKLESFIFDVFPAARAMATAAAVLLRRAGPAAAVRTVPGRLPSLPP